jgi:glycosyltransferase involved in cell wall biosynthesis
MEQIYATHNEVAKLFKDLIDEGVDLTIYSFMTPEARDERPMKGLRVVSLGAKKYDDHGLLEAAVAEDKSDAIVAHFPSMELLRAVMATDARAMAVLANSYNRRGPKAALERWRVARLLNNSRFELVSNHCMPATNHLAGFGVKRDKLIAWDVPHRFEPKDTPPKTLTEKHSYTIAYAGAIRADKGVADLIRAVAMLRAEGLQLKCTLVGGGDIDEMKALSLELGIEDRVDLLGLRPNSEVFDHFRSADVVVVPSHAEYTEGFPLTMFEAIGSRTPIVCSNHPMFVPVLKDGIHAAIFPAGNVAAFARALSRVLKQPELYALLSNNADLSWEALKGPADWRSLLSKWILERTDTDWMRQHKLDSVQSRGRAS